GAQAGNYTLSNTTAQGDITPRALELRPAPITLTYGEGLPEHPDFTADGLVAGESIASVDVIADEPYPYAHGPHALSAANAVRGSGTSLSNYDITAPLTTGALTVVAATVTVTPTGPFSKTYGDTDPVFTYDVDDSALADALSVSRESAA